MDITKVQLKRINAFQGLVIDADTWQDAHNYHREQQRLHVLAFHKTGIVNGLQVTALNPPDTSVNINPGIAVDPEGNVIIVQQKQRYRIQSHDKGTIYLVIQFRDVLTEPFQPPEGGQPTRILEAYRIQERDKLGNEPYVELARINYDPAINSIKEARIPAKPGINEIDPNFRENALKTESIPLLPVKEAAVPVSQPPQIIPQNANVRETLSIGQVVLGDAPKTLHLEGLINLARETGRQLNLLINVDENINLTKNLNKYSLIYLTGNNRFELSPEQLTALTGYLQSGGIIFGQGCSQTQDGRGSKDFGLAFNRVALQLNCKLGLVQRGHPLLSIVNVFSETPPGCEPAMLMEGGRVIYSGSDYGCAWEGGHTGTPLQREIIRNSFEIGSNVLAFAQASRVKP